MNHPRIACCVPFCGRGSRRWPSGEIICGKHYALVDRALKRQRAKYRAHFRRHGAEDTENAERVDALMWRWIKEQAIERAAT
jgi:hypothetical protein